MKQGDYCTREGAERLKDTIEAYWATRGHDVRINLVQGGFLASMRSARTDAVNSAGLTEDRGNAAR